MRDGESHSEAVRESFTRLLIDELVDLRMDGCEPPLDRLVVIAAADRLHIREALRLARRDRRWVLAWLLARYLPDIRPKSAHR
jgi:hypothetical protein